MNSSSQTVLNISSRKLNQLQMNCNRQIYKNLRKTVLVHGVMSACRGRSQKKAWNKNQSLEISVENSEFHNSSPKIEQDQSKTDSTHEDVRELKIIQAGSCNDK